MEVIQDLGKHDSVTGNIHSVITKNVKKSIFFFDEKNAYLMKTSLPIKLTKFENINCIKCMNDGYNGYFAIC